jgi:hypothetical protein
MYMLFLFALTCVAIMSAWIFVFLKIKDGVGFKIVLSMAFSVVIVVMAYLVLTTFILPGWWEVD